MWITIIVVGVIVFLLALLVFNASRRMQSLKDVRESEKIKVLTDLNFQNKIKTGTVLVDFRASWCMPCKLMIPGSWELTSVPR